MIRLTRDTVQRWMESLLHIHDSPQRTAAAFAMGVFFGFSPFLGFHTVLALAFAFVFNLNRVAVLLGVYSNLPWIMGAYYPFVTAVTAEIFGMKPPPGSVGRVRELFETLFEGDFWQRFTHAQFWHDLVALMRPLVWPYVVGSTIGALILATVAYRMALAFVIARRRHRDTEARR